MNDYWIIQGAPFKIHPKLWYYMHAYRWLQCCCLSLEGFMKSSAKDCSRPNIQFAKYRFTHTCKASELFITVIRLALTGVSWESLYDCENRFWLYMWTSAFNCCLGCILSGTSCMCTNYNVNTLYLTSAGKLANSSCD